MRQVPFWHFKVILLSFCCVLEGDIAYQSLLYHCHLFFLFCFVFFTFWSFSFSFGSFCVKHLFISHNLNIILGKKVSLLVIFFSNRSRYFQVCASFQALCIIFVIQLITQVMTQTFWQGGSVQGRIVSLSAALFSCHVSTGPLSLSHNISAQRRHPAPRWVAITGNTATLVSECVPRLTGAQVVPRRQTGHLQPTLYTHHWALTDWQALTERFVRHSGRIKK